MQKFLNWLIGIIIALILLLAAAYFLAKKYEDPVREYIVKEVNKRLESDLHVSDINFSLIQRFPSASLVMDSVWAEENVISRNDPDTLFYFTKVYLNFNIMDIIKGVYRIHEIELKEGFAHLNVDSLGRDNFHIWKETNDTTGFFLALDRVNIQLTSLVYHNKLRQQFYDVSVQNLYFTGQFSDENYTMGVDGYGVVRQLEVKGNSYLHNRQVAISSDLDINSIAEKYVFRKGEILVDDKLDFSISGKFEGDRVDLKVTGNELDVIKTLSLLPSESTSLLADYESSGILAFDATLVGVFNKTENPRLNAKFSFENASVSRKGSNWKFTHLSGSGFLDNGESKDANTSRIELQDLKGNFNGNPFNASVVVTNFNTPIILGDANLVTDLQGVDEFFNLEFLEESSGKLSLKAHIETTINDPEKILPSDFLNAKADGSIVVENATVKFKGDERIYTIEKADFKIENNGLSINTYLGRINDCKIDVSGNIDHFLEYIFTNTGVLDVKGKITAGDIDLGELFPMRTTENSEESGVVISLPVRANWDLQIVAERFKKGKFTAEKLSGRLQMDSFKAEATGLRFLSQQGSIQGMFGLYRFAENQFGMKTDFQAEQVDVKTMFETFDNFDQDFVKAEVIEGIANVNIVFQAFCDSTFRIDTKSILTSIDLKIQDGALIGFQPLIDLADYIKQKPMLRLFVSADELRKRLENVHFATLENEVSIRNGVISIPQMEIKSSAIDLNVNGMHTFDDQIDYALDFSLSDVLALKDRKEPYNEYVQRDNQGKTRMYFTMKGTTDDFEVNLVKTDFKPKLNLDFSKENSEVKNTLSQDFSLFARDSLAKNQAAAPKELQIEFDADAGTRSNSNKTPSSNTNLPTKDQEKNPLNRIIKRTETDKKKLKEGEFEDDDF